MLPAMRMTDTHPLCQEFEFALPVGQLLLWVVFAVLFAIVAAVWPARMDVLQSISYE